MKTYYERNLPHWHPTGATLFITFRLKDSIPRAVLDDLKLQNQLLQKEITDKESLYTAQKKYFGIFDKRLDANPNGPYWLTQPEITAMVGQAFHFYDGKDYKLWAYTIMSNHVHLLITPTQEAPELPIILQKIKRYTAAQANKLLNRTGNPFWEEESYDHVVRKEGEFERIVAYILNNPVKAGLVKYWEEWPWSYCTPEIFSGE